MHYYGKGDVIVYRLNRDRKDAAAVFGANVRMLLRGEAFWPTYCFGDNSNLIATDSIKNFIQRETLGWDGTALEQYCRYIAEKFIKKYIQVDGVQISAEEIRYMTVDGGGFVPQGPERAFATVRISNRTSIDVTSGIRGFRLLKLSGSTFRGFVRDEYTTLPDIPDRPLHMWLDLEWRYANTDAAFARSCVSAVRRVVHDVFGSFASASIQQIIHQMGVRVLADVPEISEVSLEANNRTWDAIVERPPRGVYTDARPPYGCIGLTLKR